jgi:AraC-like DNA-binding protein
LHLFEGENLGEDLDRNQIHVLNPEEATFVTNFMELIEKEWQNPEVKVEDLERNMGISKSRLYREMIRLTGKSPSVFLLHYRLRQSVQLLQKQKGNVSEIAYDSGFNSPSYFAKCFRKKYGIIPSAFVMQ